MANTGTCAYLCEDGQVQIRRPVYQARLMFVVIAMAMCMGWSLGGMRYTGSNNPDAPLGIVEFGFFRH